jgi:TetR/AcrR family transcriptional regulator, tetracycline repressor protein
VVTARDARRVAITTAALEIVQRDGLEQLTMRRLAERTALQLPLIYRVFANKQALIDAMAERIFAHALRDAPASLPDSQGDWENETVELAGFLRSALLAYRDGARIVGGSYASQLNNMAFADRLIGSMERGGLHGTAALWGASTVFCYVLGEVLEQQSSTLQAVDEVAAFLGSSSFPHLSAMPIHELINFDARFDYGLTAIIRGLPRALPSTSRRPSEGSGSGRPKRRPDRAGPAPTGPDRAVTNDSTCAPS